MKEGIKLFFEVMFVIISSTLLFILCLPLIILLSTIAILFAIFEKTINQKDKH